MSSVTVWRAYHGVQRCRSTVVVPRLGPEIRTARRSQTCVPGVGVCVRRDTVPVGSFLAAAPRQGPMVATAPRS